LRLQQPIVVRLNRDLNQYVPLLRSAGISLAPVEAEENINNAVVKTDEPVTAPALIS
jgi:hypothetical protein